MWCRRLSLAFKAVNSKFVCGNQELGIRTRVHLVNSTQNQGWVGDILRLGLDALRRAQAARLRQVPKGPVLFEHANLFDAESGAMKPGSSVLVEGNAIRAVGADGTVEVPPGTRRIDAAGRALCPGTVGHAQSPGACRRPPASRRGRHGRARHGGGALPSASA